MKRTEIFHQELDKKPQQYDANPQFNTVLKFSYYTLKSLWRRTTTCPFTVLTLLSSDQLIPVDGPRLLVSVSGDSKFLFPESPRDLFLHPAQ